MEAPVAHVFSLNGAHLHVLARLSGLVRCAMNCGRSEPRFVTKLTLIEDGSEADMRLSYEVAFDLHTELERVAFKRRLRVCSSLPQAAAMALGFELGRLHDHLRECDRVIVVCFDEVVEAELDALRFAQVINPAALAATDEFWRFRERNLLLQVDRSVALTEEAPQEEVVAPPELAVAPPELAVAPPELAVAPPELAVVLSELAVAPPEEAVAPSDEVELARDVLREAPPPSGSSDNEAGPEQCMPPQPESAPEAGRDDAVSEKILQSSTDAEQEEQDEVAPRAASPAPDRSSNFEQEPEPGELGGQKSRVPQSWAGGEEL
jgi:hypothetical protein